jgi:hypothetical protein
MDKLTDVSSRRDLTTAARIDAAIDAQSLRGGACVAKELERDGVSFSVTVRVLMDPTRRRAFRTKSKI